MKPIGLMGRNELEAELERLRSAIRLHRDEKGHDRCFLDDDRLYAVLGEPIPDRPLPSKGEFLLGCARFYEHRKKGGDYVTVPERCGLCEGTQHAIICGEVAPGFDGALVCSRELDHPGGKHCDGAHAWGKE